MPKEAEMDRQRGGQLMSSADLPLRCGVPSAWLRSPLLFHPFPAAGAQGLRPPDKPFLPSHWHGLQDVLLAWPLASGNFFPIPFWTHVPANCPLLDSSFVLGESEFPTCTGFARPPFAVADSCSGGGHSSCPGHWGRWCTVKGLLLEQAFSGDPLKWVLRQVLHFGRQAHLF